MLRKLLSISHWTQKTRETTLCRDEEGFLNLRLLGGAEYGQLLYIGESQRGTARLESGKLHTGDLLLEVNEAPVSGLTLRDALDLLADIPDPVRIKTVPQGSQLNSDLRHFLKQVFTKGSADFDLQERVRHNLYIRTVPCTTRAPREGERPGIDYHFISLSEFHALERAGGLLETGKFDGNYYGIPVPPILPTDAALTLDPSMLGCPPRSPSFPSVTEKRPNREEAHGSQGHSSAPGAAANFSNSHVTSSNANQDMAPAGEDGTEQHGIAGQPEGWVQAAASRRESRSADIERTQTEPCRGQDSLFVPDVSQMPGYSVFATITKTNNTFGFTIAGGNRPSELLQIVSVAAGGPAEQTGNVQIHDVIVAVDQASVLGSTHGKVVRLFQSVPEGAQTELHLRRGYPSLYHVEPQLLSQVDARRAASTHPAPIMAVLPVAVMQSPGGPSFTVTRASSGYARVTRVSDRRLCPDLREGDLLVKVNGRRVRALSDQQLDEVLRRHTQAGDVVLLVQRAVAGTQPLTELTIHLADDSAQAQTGVTEGRNGDRNGCQGFSVGSKPQDVAAPCALGRARTESSKPRHVVPGQHEEHKLFEFTPLSSLVEAGDEASLDSSLNPRKFGRPAEGEPTERQEGDARPHLDGRPRGDNGAASTQQLGSRGRDGTSSKYDSREGNRRARSLSRPRDIPGISSRYNVCDLQPDGVRLPLRLVVARKATIPGPPEPMARSRRKLSSMQWIWNVVHQDSGSACAEAIGDQLVEINGKPTVGMSHARAVELIRHGQDRIHLLMRRGTGQAPEFGPDAVSRPDFGEVTVVPVRQEHPAQAPRGEVQFGAARGLARPQSHHPRALLSSGPEHPTTRQGRLSRGQSQATDARPVAGSTRGYRRNCRNQQGDDSGPETDLRPRSRALRDHPRQQSALGSRADKISDPTQSQAPLDRSAPGTLGELKAQIPSVYTRPEALLDSRPQALLDSSPNVPVEARFHSLPRYSRPDASVESTVQSLPSYRRPQALGNSGPLSEESTETDSDSGETDWEEDTASSSPELPALSSFDEQRQLSSMIGRGLNLSRGPLLPPSGTAEGEYCVHCSSQRGTKDGKRGRLQGLLSPGPWLVPEGQKLLGILGR